MKRRKILISYFHQPLILHTEYVYIHMYIHVCICIYRLVLPTVYPHCWYICVYMYIYTHIYIHTCTHGFKSPGIDSLTLLGNQSELHVQINYYIDTIQYQRNFAKIFRSKQTCIHTSNIANIKVISQTSCTCVDRPTPIYSATNLSRTEFDVLTPKIHMTLSRALLQWASLCFRLFLGALPFGEFPFLFI